MLNALAEVLTDLAGLTLVAVGIVALGAVLEAAPRIRRSPAARDLAAWRDRRAAARAQHRADRELAR